MIVAWELPRRGCARRYKLGVRPQNTPFEEELECHPSGKSGAPVYAQRCWRCSSAWLLPQANSAGTWATCTPRRRPGTAPTPNCARVRPRWSATARRWRAAPLRCWKRWWPSATRSAPWAGCMSMPASTPTRTCAMRVRKSASSRRRRCTRCSTKRPPGWHRRSRPSDPSACGHSSPANPRSRRAST